MSLRYLLFQGLLLQRLMLEVKPSANQLPSLSDSYDDSPPPLIDSDGNYDNGVAPLISLDNEQSTNGSVVSKIPRVVATATSHTVHSIQKVANGVACQKYKPQVPV